MAARKRPPQEGMKTGGSREFSANGRAQTGYMHEHVPTLLEAIPALRQ
jgi:hypothetical protein